MTILKSRPFKKKQDAKQGVAKLVVDRFYTTYSHSPLAELNVLLRRDKSLKVDIEVLQQLDGMFVGIATTNLPELRSASISDSETAGTSINEVDDILSHLTEGVAQLTFFDTEAPKLSIYQAIFAKILPHAEVPQTKTKIKKRLSSVWVNINDFVSALKLDEPVYIFPNRKQFMKDINSEKARLYPKTVAKQTGLDILFKQLC